MSYKKVVLVALVFGLSIIVGCGAKDTAENETTIDHSQMSMDMSDEHSTAVQNVASDEFVEQRNCPVMPQNEIDSSLYVDHNGERIYVCCSFCISEFPKDPEKYLTVLENMGQSPQKL